VNDDLTAAQFAAACRQRGFRAKGFMGYFRLNIPGHPVEVSVWNCGSMRRRDHLAYLLEEQERARKAYGAECLAKWRKKRQAEWTP
jgi:hypothetical protein